MSVKMRNAAVLILAGLAAACGSSRMPSEARGGDILLPLDRSVTEAAVPRHATLEVILRNHQISDDITTGLVQAVRSVFDPRRLREDQTYRITKSLDGFLREFRYEIDADRFLRVISTRLPDMRVPAFAAEVVEYPREVQVEAVSAGITSERPSLSAALEDRGENIYLALKLADAFSGLVDFNSDLQAGDEFKVLFDRVYRNGQPGGYGDLRAAVLENDGRTFTAIPFELDGRLGWYDADGRSLKRQFLKSPLPFQTTVSSGFSYRRLHPVTGNFAAHPAVDYRAPYGAKVVAVAGGRVESASYAGNSGNLVVIRHDGGYESMYLHLSRFNVRRGERVQQGDVIGFVGNTGRVTATHLDFRIRRNGRYMNPVTLFRSLPPGDPIPASRMAAFTTERDRLLAELDTLAAAASATPPLPSRATNDAHHQN